MHPTQTFQLAIHFNGEAPEEARELVKAWLLDNGTTSFVEGSVDGIEIDYDFGDKSYLEEAYEHFSKFSNLTIYKYDQEDLEHLRQQIQAHFGDAITATIASMDTKEWMEGWKASFKPVATKTFYIYPPWEKPSNEPGKISVEIEPGMAFGTGNHATTKLCVQAIENLIADLIPQARSDMTLLDVGTGSGILAIAAAKLGVGQVFATDIDADSILATQRNAEQNKVTIYLEQGSVMLPGAFKQNQGAATSTYPMVIANILFPILRDIMSALVAALEPNGTLVLSGLITDDEQPMREVCEKAGLRFNQRAQLDDWICLVFNKA